jgi:hypothetical protein
VAGRFGRFGQCRQPIGTQIVAMAKSALRKRVDPTSFIPSWIAGALVTDMGDSEIQLTKSMHLGHSLLWMPTKQQPISTGTHKIIG